MLTMMKTKNWESMHRGHFIKWWKIGLGTDWLWQHTWSRNCEYHIFNCTILYMLNIRDTRQGT